MERDRDIEILNLALGQAINTKNNKMVFKIIQDHRIDVNKKYGGKNLTPLIYAVTEGSEVIVESLLKHPDIDVNIKDNSGNNALSVALYNLGEYYYDIFTKLILAGSTLKEQEFCYYVKDYGKILNMDHQSFIDMYPDNTDEEIEEFREKIINLVDILVYYYYNEKLACLKNDRELQRIINSSLRRQDMFVKQ